MYLILGMIKVAYICHFSTTQIRQHLHLKSLFFGNLLRRLWKLPRLFYSDIGVWNADFIKAFENNDELDCHVILTHWGMRKKKQKFVINKVNYVLLQGKENLISKVNKTLFGVVARDDSAYYARLIKAEVDSINPDIIIVCGAENPIYSSSILLINNKPIFVIIQTLLNSPKRIAMGVSSDLRRRLENAIFDHAGYFGTFEPDVVNYIRNRNKSAVFYRLMFPSSPPSVKFDVEKQYDFTFFANGLTKNKGIEDAIIGLSYVCKHYPTVTFNVIGNCSLDYMILLKKIIADLGLEGRIIFHGHFQFKEDALIEVAKARIAVLPGITASFNSTVRETMYMNIPTIVYDNDVVRMLNNEKRILLSAKMEDTMDLGEKMLYAYEHPAEMRKMAEYARVYADNHFSVEAVGRTLLTYIRSTVNHFYHNEGIR